MDHHKWCLKKAAKAELGDGGLRRKCPESVLRLLEVSERFERVDYFILIVS